MIAWWTGEGKCAWFRGQSDPFACTFSHRVNWYPFFQLKAPFRRVPLEGGHLLAYTAHKYYLINFRPFY